ncbi:Firmicu-CTERM sorting domain-containing protein [Anaerocolumna xylanovorans]|uniref:Firmicu-CTERM domain-containing protein n=1 Tax=Anaerocolumna xylanovorans DSM 12503 TaxID=1121345 RepID=A0A1M7YCB9_9FIRM|nr:Firmicu-CTERM sorting domain-containing protein [Anaerocolumna xylanovorans]SHO50241.1 hypothetical protein SAMN02745217_02651 [Anaerocolumna xylanovorans DSM 12503]
MKRIVKFIFTAIILMQLTGIKAYADAPAITIDGYFDDWMSMPKATVTYNSQYPNYISLVKDDTSIYLFYESNKQSSGSYIPLDSISLTIGSINTQIFLRYPTSSGTTDWSRGVYDLGRGTYLGLSPFTYWPNNSLGEAALVKNDGNYVEMRMSIAALENNLSMPSGTINNGARVSVNIPGLGGTTVSAVDTPTGFQYGFVIPLIFGIFIARRVMHRGLTYERQMAKSEAL